MPEVTPRKQDKNYEETQAFISQSETSMNHEQVLASFSKACNQFVAAVSDRAA